MLSLADIRKSVCIFTLDYTLGLFYNMTPIYNEEIVIEKLHNPATAREAFGQVVEHYGERIYWQIRKMVVSHEDADDLLQNTFLKAWNSIELFRAEARLSTWLYRIAVNETITFLNRERQRNSITVDDDDSFLLNNIEADPWFDGDDLQLRLQQAIARLPEKQRLVFNMRYFDEMKYEDISLILGTSVGALKASYHHAAKKIEEFLLSHD